MGGWCFVYTLLAQVFSLSSSMFQTSFLVFLRTLRFWCPGPAIFDPISLTHAWQVYKQKLLRLTIINSVSAQVQRGVGSSHYSGAVSFYPIADFIRP